jgi:hypothetical protein
MDKIPNQRLDWVRKSSHVFPLREAAAGFGVTYSANGKTYSLDDYLQQGDVLGLLVLKDDQIVYERYLHDAVPADRFLPPPVPSEEAVPAAAATRLLQTPGGQNSISRNYVVAHVTK